MELPIHPFFLLLQGTPTALGYGGLPPQLLSQGAALRLCLHRCCAAWFDKGHVKSSAPDHMAASARKGDANTWGCSSQPGPALRWYAGVFSVQEGPF